MATVSNQITETLPREMQTPTYAILREIEGTHWWYLGRRSIIASFVGRIVTKLRADDPSFSRILGSGWGHGRSLELVSQYGPVEGVDVSTEAVEFCRARAVAPVKLAVAESLPYDNGSFDLVTAFDVIEPLDDDVEVFDHVKRSH